MSQYDEQIREVSARADATEGKIVQDGHLSVDAWMLIKSYIRDQIALSGLLYGKAIEEMPVPADYPDKDS